MTTNSSLVQPEREDLWYNLAGYPMILLLILVRELLKNAMTASSAKATPAHSAIVGSISRPAPT